MGGHSFPELEGQPRLDPETYTSIERTFVDAINTSSVGYVVAHRIPYCGDKSSFGDIDLLIECTDVLRNEDILQIIRKSISPIEHLKILDTSSEGGQLHLLVRFKNSVLAQVDFPCVRTGCGVEMALMYMSYGDLGGIIGTICTAHKLSFGSEGLFVKMRYEKDMTQHYGDLNLSKSPQDIFQFLGLDYSRYSRGFSSQDDLFEWVTSCRLFSLRIFFNRDYTHSQHRRRSRKRKMYKDFLTWMENRFQNEMMAAQVSRVEASVAKLCSHIDIRFSQLERGMKSNHHELREILGYTLEREMESNNDELCERLGDKEDETEHGRQKDNLEDDGGDRWIEVDRAIDYFGKRDEADLMKLDYESKRRIAVQRRKVVDMIKSIYIDIPEKQIGRAMTHLTNHPHFREMAEEGRVEEMFEIAVSAIAK